MKILFVIPPYRTTDVLVAQLYPMPLAAVSLGTVLQNAGHQVTIKDFLAVGPSVRKAKADGPASFQGRSAPPYLHFGTPLAECEGWLAAHAAEFDAVGLCCCQCNVFETAAVLAACIRAVGKPLVVGGPFVTTAPDQAAELFKPDAMVMGEGEAVVEEAFRRVVAGERGIRLQGSPVDLGDLPLPDWRLAPPENYPRFAGKVRGVLTISRGCPWACNFCSVWTVMGRKHRRQEPERIKAELMNLWSRGVRYFCFLDDNLFISERAVDELLGVVDELRREVPGFDRARFYVEEGIEVRVAAKPGIIKRIVEAGFENVGLGVETVNAAQRDAAKKPYTTKELRDAVWQCHAAGIAPRAFYIVGFPGDTVSSVCSDIMEFSSMGMAVRPNNLKLYPGTEMTAEFRRRGWIGDDYDWRLSSFYTPDKPGLTFLQVKRLKTILGAIGKAAELFGVDPFRDSFETIAKRLEDHRYTLQRDGEKVRIRGNMFRPTPFRKLAEFILIGAGAAGATSEVDSCGDEVTAWPLERPADPIQKEIVRALGVRRAAAENVQATLF